MSALWEREHSFLQPPQARSFQRLRPNKTLQQAPQRVDFPRHRPKSHQAQPSLVIIQHLRHELRHLLLLPPRVREQQTLALSQNLYLPPFRCLIGLIPRALLRDPQLLQNLPVLPPSRPLLPLRVPHRFLFRSLLLLEPSPLQRRGEVQPHGRTSVLLRLRPSPHIKLGRVLAPPRVIQQELPHSQKGFKSLL